MKPISNPEEIAARLAEAAESGRVQTTGQVRDWLKRVSLLPAKTRRDMMKRLRKTLDNGTISEIKRILRQYWGERP